MKNWKKIAIMILICTLLLLPTESNAASIGFTDVSVKNMFLVIAILILILLLYLGYRMDSNENKVKEPKVKKAKDVATEKSKYSKKSNDIYDFNDTEYEEDSNGYEVDNVNPEEISDGVEYEEDEDDFEDIISEENVKINNVFEDNEESLYASFQNNVNNGFDSTINFDTSDLKKELNKSSYAEEDDFEDIDSITKSYSKDCEGKEIITPIEENIETEENEEIITFIEENTETIEDEEYGEEFDISIIDKIDEEDDVEEENSFIKELNSFKEPECDFAGFSVASPKSEEIIQDNKNVFVPKRYTKVKSKVVENVVSDNLDDIDFLRQMEKNLELGNSDEEVVKVEEVKTEIKKKTTTKTSKAKTTTESTKTAKSTKAKKESANETTKTTTRKKKND